MKKNIWIIMGTVMLSMLLISTIPRFLLGSSSDSEVNIQEVQEALSKFDEKVQEIDDVIKEFKPSVLEQSECPVKVSAQIKCLQYPLEKHKLFKIENYGPGPGEVYVYYVENENEQENDSIILKCAFNEDGGFEVREYDLDGDGVFEYSLADMNNNRVFDKEEIYKKYRDIWRPLFPVLPHPGPCLVPYGI